jgi:hypothetical protein
MADKKVLLQLALETLKDMTEARINEDIDDEIDREEDMKFEQLADFYLGNLEDDDFTEEDINLASSVITEAVEVYDLVYLISIISENSVGKELVEIVKLMVHQGLDFDKALEY